MATLLEEPSQQLQSFFFRNGDGAVELKKFPISI
jgi:hypothetical protein